MIVAKVLGKLEEIAGPHKGIVDAKTEDGDGSESSTMWRFSFEPSVSGSQSIDTKGISEKKTYENDSRERGNGENPEVSVMAINLKRGFDKDEVRHQKTKQSGRHLWRPKAGS